MLVISVCCVYFYGNLLILEMMKKLLSVFIFLVGIFAFSQEGAKIEFKTETINYGEVVKGEDNGIREFEFTNTGDAPLIIKSVKSSCGCTIPTKPEAPILPGKSDKIVVKYNMNPGPISKTITVETNAVNKPGGMIPLRIKGTVVKKDK